MYTLRVFILSFFVVRTSQKDEASGTAARRASHVGPAQRQELCHLERRGGYPSGANEQTATADRLPQEGGFRQGTGERKNSIRVLLPRTRPS